jgi:hypothetical protein
MFLAEAFLLLSRLRFPTIALVFDFLSIAWKYRPFQKMRSKRKIRSATIILADIDHFKVPTILWVALPMMRF